MNKLSEFIAEVNAPVLTKKERQASSVKHRAISNVLKSGDYDTFILKLFKDIDIEAKKIASQDNIPFSELNLDKITLRRLDKNNQ